MPNYDQTIYRIFTYIYRAGIQVYKILNNIDKNDRNKLFLLAPYTIKLYKERSRLNVRANSFGNRVIYA